MLFVDYAAPSPVVASLCLCRGKYYKLSFAAQHRLQLEEEAKLEDTSFSALPCANLHLLLKAEMAGAADLDAELLRPQHEATFCDACSKRALMQSCCENLV